MLGDSLVNHFTGYDISHSLENYKVHEKNFPVERVKCDALRDLAPFVQFKKREKQPWRSVNFSKGAGFSL